jgi:nitrate/nitrite transporter NarK
MWDRGGSLNGTAARGVAQYCGDGCAASNFQCGSVWVPRSVLDHTECVFKDAAAAGGLAFVSSVGALGGVFSPIFIGWIKEATGSFYYALGTLGCVFLVSLLLLNTCFPHREKIGLVKLETL